MRFKYWAALALALVSACTPTDSGIEGYITAGPACPVMQADVPCPDQPYAGTLTILAENGRTKVTAVTADSSGYFRVALAPGTYIVHPEAPGVLPRGVDVIVRVLPNQFTRQDIVYDTGIR
ncbi:MAG: carboxypeptidase-like regulatory domain-containing protein [Chloroflexota bacterium]